MSQVVWNRGVRPLCATGASCAPRILREVGEGILSESGPFVVTVIVVTILVILFATT